MVRHDVCAAPAAEPEAERCREVQEEAGAGSSSEASPLVTLPLLADPGSYLPCTFDYTARCARAVLRRPASPVGCLAVRPSVPCSCAASPFGPLQTRRHC
jgi:hypothetical protein